jgi:hypothetical protein
MFVHSIALSVDLAPVSDGLNFSTCYTVEAPDSKLLNSNRCIFAIDTTCKVFSSTPTYVIYMFASASPEAVKV